jgi:hypothetical protein
MLQHFPIVARRALATALLLAWLVVGRRPAAGQDRDVAAEFKAAKASVTAQLRDKKKETRLAAVKKLEGWVTPEAAKVLLFQGVGHNDEDMRRASFDALARMNGDAEICSFLKTTISKQWKQGKPQPETFAGLAVLLASELPEAHEDALALVAGAVERPQGHILLINLADDLSSCRGDSACRAIRELTGIPLFAVDVAFRRAVEQALVQVRSKDAVTTLIKLLDSVKGEVRIDIVRYLTDLSGQQLGIESAPWNVWWDGVKAKFEFPPEQKQQLGGGVAAAARKVAVAGPSYYGLPLSGAKIIFVIDTSGSMNGARIVAAKRELVKAVEELPEQVQFNVIAFNSRAYPWQGKLIPATQENKQNAMYFIAAQVLGNGTASYDALEAALQFEGEAIYFLTDGAPFGGRITNPTMIVRNISEANRSRRMTSNSIGIGVGAQGNPFDSFLANLAQQNFGQYERVDQ